MRGDGRSLKELLRALKGICIDPCLFQNTARRISGCYCNLCAAEIDGKYKVVGPTINRGPPTPCPPGRVPTLCVRVIIHKWVHPLSEPRSGWHFFLDRLFHVFLLNFLGAKGPGMFNVTSPQEVGDDAEHRPPDGEYHRIRQDRQDELELGPINAKARCNKNIHPANQRDDAEEWVEPHAIGTIQVGLPAA